MSGKEKEIQTNVYDVLNRLLGIVSTIVFIPVIVLLVLSAGYLFAVFGMLDGTQVGQHTEIKQTLMSVWESLIPIAREALSILLPVIVLVLLVGAVKWVLPTGTLNVEILKDNLTSIIAIIVLGTICILPLLGKEIPVVLTNIALVIIGYYFGKLNG
ncbi:hypothetical protein JAO78_008770 [Alishewanella sp. 16-MA]|uniref:Uncharacterized protein n=1 Tax=Alishewanella maricola TaxID=2795740 RepID=A0ABS8C3J4_9ALTE|nr:hypothetical protein [Alishewanella maricola]MCB5226907.1 hypothetical protein [Alishewanella maricola]